MKYFKRYFLQKYKYFPYFTVFGGFLVHISLGGIFTYGSMFPYILEYMNNQSTSIGYIYKLDSVWIISLSQFGRGASMTLGGFIEDRIGPSLTVLLGGSIMSIGYILTYFTIHVHIVLVVITYGLIVGIGTGIAYGVAMTIPSEHFPNSRGLISGIVLSGFGIGSLGFDLLHAYYISNDVTNKSHVNISKVPLSFILMGCVYFCIQLIGAPLIRRPTKESDRNSIEEFNVFGTSESLEVNIKPHQLLFFSKFWIIWITYALNSVFSFLFIFLHKMWGKVLNVTDARLLIATSVGGVFSIFGRIIWGYLIDKYGYKFVIWLSTLSFTIIFGTFYLSSKIGDDSFKNNGRYAMYLVWVFITFFIISGNFSIFPAVCVKAFGSKNYTGNFGVLFTGYSFSGILTSILILTIYDVKTEKTDFLIIFLIGSFISFLSSLLSIFYRTSLGKSFINVFLC